jgi:CubicO group peptidase (beta-lactamase class C family)
MKTSTFARLLALPLALYALVATPSCARSSDDSDQGSSDVTSDEGPPMSVDAMIARAKQRDYWPKGEDWRNWPDELRNPILASDPCKDFVTFMFPPADADARRAKELNVSVDKLPDAEQALRTDSVMAIKHGRVMYENYVGAYAGHPQNRHSVWSASKSITAGVIGAIVEQSERLTKGEKLPGAKLTRSGKPVVLATPLSDLMDMSELSSDPRVGALTIEQLLGMAPNLKWAERYDGDITQSNIIRMLWLDGPKDMSGYAANVGFGPEGPGNRFIYSSGNTVILMRALKALFGEEYDRMPWTALFDRLGMQDVTFERDRKGVFVGSSYVHMPLHDLARFGYAYLNGGFYAGEQVIHPKFVQGARDLALGMRVPGTSDADIIEEAGFYGLGFWINARPDQLTRDRIRSFGPNGPKAKFFPNAPTDMFFAAGHYGQNIFVFPQDDLLIVRMSHDKEYWTKLDRMMSKGRACFNQQR